MPPSKYLSVIAAAVLASACGGSKSSDEGSSPGAPPAAAAATPAATATAKATELFATRCTPCHGPEGRGDGVASKTLTPPPRNFTDAAWQASVTDDHIEQIIKYGGAAVGKSPAMPANPDLSDPAVVTALRAHIRGLGGK
ncbi:MAG: c-type cytochrome [Kofleriaceae bacterium]